MSTDIKLARSAAPATDCWGDLDSALVTRAGRRGERWTREEQKMSSSTHGNVGLGSRVDCLMTLMWLAHETNVHSTGDAAPAAVVWVADLVANVTHKLPGLCERRLELKLMAPETHFDLGWGPRGLEARGRRLTSLADVQRALATGPTRDQAWPRLATLITNVDLVWL